MVKGVAVDCSKYVVVDFSDVVICSAGPLVRPNSLVAVYSSDVVILTVSGVKSPVDDVPDIAVEDDDGVFVVVSVETVSVVTFVGVDGSPEIVAVVESVTVVVDVGSVVIKENGEVFSAFDSDEISSGNLVEVTVGCIPVNDVVSNGFSKSVEDSSAILVVEDSTKVDVVIGCISSEAREDCSDSVVTEGDSFEAVIVLDFADVDSVDVDKPKLYVDVISGDSVDISSIKVEGDIFEIVD